jgi:hypothetical protein
MEAKWGSIAMAVIFVAMFSSFAISNVAEHRARGQCLASFSMSDRPAEEITQICN